MANLKRIDFLLSNHSLVFNNNHAPDSRIIGIIEQNIFDGSVLSSGKIPTYLIPRAIIYKDRTNPSYISSSYEFTKDTLKDVLEVISIFQNK